MLVSSAMEHKLPLRQRLALLVHLSMCKSCRRFRKQLQLLRDIARQYEAMLPAEQLPPEASDRIIKTLKAHFI